MTDWISFMTCLNRTPNATSYLYCYFICVQIKKMFYSHIASSCVYEMEKCVFEWNKVVVHWPRKQLWNVRISLCKLILSQNFVMFGWKWINSKSPLWCQWGSQLLPVEVCCFHWMGQQLLWDFFGTPTASQVVRYTFTCKTNILLALRCLCACYFNAWNTDLFHLESDEHSKTRPLLSDQYGTADQLGRTHSIWQGCHPCLVVPDPPAVEGLSSGGSWHDYWPPARFVQRYDSEWEANTC